jgi:hypothetical protein
MTAPSGYAKTLALPTGFDAPRLLRYDDVTAHAISRDDLGADVRGINLESRPDPRDPRRHLADRSGHRGGGTTSTWSDTRASSGTASHSRSASRPRRRLYRLRIPPPEWRAAVGAHFTRPYGPRFVRTNRSRHTSPSNRSTRQQGAGCSEILDAPPSDHEITCRIPRPPRSGCPGNWGISTDSGRAMSPSSPSSRHEGRDSKGRSTSACIPTSNTSASRIELLA